MNFKNIIEERILNGLTIKLEIAKDTYSKETILKTVYKFTDKIYFYLETNNSTFIVYFTKKNNTVDLNNIIDLFTNELLDQELRSVILKETSKVRDAITTRALLSLGTN